MDLQDTQVFGAKFGSSSHFDVITPCRGVRRDAWLRFHVPRVRVRVTMHDGHRVRELPIALDTLHVDADAMRLDLTWRAHVSVHEGLDDLAWVRIDAEDLVNG